MSTTISVASTQNKEMEMKVEATSAPLNLFFYSTPSSPRLSTFGDENLDNVSLLSDERESHSFSSVPFDWELMPGIPKSTDFEFDFSGQLLAPSLSSADQLFDGGVIRPLKPPPGIFHSPVNSPKSPKSPITSKFRPKQRQNEDDPFEAALHTTKNRGRDPSVRRCNSRKGISRSLSPLRVSEFALLHQKQQEQLEKEHNSMDKSLLSPSSRVGSKKWRLKDLFLFRSASEGRPAGGAKKYSFLSRRNSSSIDNNDKDGSSKGGSGSSFRSSTSTSGGSVSKRRAQANISAHEMHYTAKKAVFEESKKKTSLPYRHGLLGCLGFNPILHNLSNAFAS